MFSLKTAPCSAMSDRHNEEFQGSRGNPVYLIDDDDVSVGSSPSPVASRTAGEDGLASSIAEQCHMVAETAGFDVEPSAAAGGARGQKRTRVPETDDEDDADDDECDDASDTCLRRPEKRARHDDDGDDDENDSDDEAEYEQKKNDTFSDVSPQQKTEAEKFAKKFLDGVAMQSHGGGDFTLFGYNIHEVRERLVNAGCKPKELPKTSEGMCKFVSTERLSHVCHGDVYYLAPNNGDEFRRCFGDSPTCLQLDMGLYVPISDRPRGDDE